MAHNSVFLRKVALVWKRPDAEAKERYKLLARNERERYKVELAMWEREKASTEQENLYAKVPRIIRHMEHQAMDPDGGSVIESSCSHEQDSPGWFVPDNPGSRFSSTRFANDAALVCPSSMFDTPERPVNLEASLEWDGDCQGPAGFSMLQYNPLELEHTIHACADVTISSRHIPSAYPYTQQMLYQSYEWEHEAWLLEPLPLDVTWPTVCMNEKRLDASVPGN
jgi:hypothetical protein